MCDPVTIAGIALTAGSTLANTIGNAKAGAARKDAMAAERIRQDTLTKEAEALSLATEDKAKQFGGDQAGRATTLADYYGEQAAAEPPPASAIPQSQSNITVREEANQRGRASEATSKAASALGQLRAFGDVLGDFSRRQARDAGQIGQIGGFKEGSANVLPYELDAASHKGDGFKLFGDLLGGIGGIATSAGLSGAGGGLGSLFGVNTNAAPKVKPGNYGATGSMARGRALDRGSMPGYAGYASPANTRLYDMFGV